MTLPKERIQYSAIVDRGKIALPDGARLVVWTIVNLEVWDISRPMPRQVLPTPGGNPLLPDVPNWTWHEYGMRVGFWRLQALYERLGIRPTVSLNAKVCLDYPRVALACKNAGWEFMAHGFEQIPLHHEKDQQEMIRRSLETIKEFTDKRPIGWLGPGLTETYDTPDYLTAAGIKYVADWVHDEEPTRIETVNGPLISLPFTVECNDITMMVVQHQEAGYWTRKCIDTFNQLYEESAQRPKFMAIVVHPFITGQPSRIRHHESIYNHIAQHPGVVHWDGEKLLNWYLGLPANLGTETTSAPQKAIVP
jgi:allantoinase